MRRARIFNPCTGNYIYFDYDKFIEVDSKPLTKKELNAIRKYMEETKKWYTEENRDL